MLIQSILVGSGINCNCFAGKLLSDADALKALQSDAVCCRMHEFSGLHWSHWLSMAATWTADAV